uniref:Acyl-coenzyme A thioesterase 9, mitochondrial-like n=1 Tax=Phallusia mammillata TaxID=59560 RepID=A0A6F9D548_9ASCI|nr:acyl-coenzyme A thioesterase 9, mitochondrial-like [Phallusia mammillata]
MCNFNMKKLLTICSVGLKLLPICPLQVASRRNIMSIQDIRNALRKVVGASKSFSDGKPDRSTLSKYLVGDQKALTPRHMNDSRQHVLIPLSDKSVREKYLNGHGSIRFGILLEDLDLLAGSIAYLHCDPQTLSTGESPLSIVTAMVDEIKIHKDNVTDNADIHMRGHVTWAGKSSLEICMWLQQNDKPILDAQFVMVARDPESKRAAVVYPLETENSEEEHFISEGEKHKTQRLLEAKESLLQKPPTNEEQQHIHKLFVNTLDPSSKSFRSRVLPPDSVWMESTKLKNAIICFPEQRNIHNKVFGGFLMRKAFELAWANACVFSNSRPSVAFMDDIFFHCPVPIGSLLLMSSQISFTEGKYFMARVNAEVMNTLTGESRTSNVFYFTFTCTKPKLPAVSPKTYGESMLYLDCMRRFKTKILPWNEL